MTALKGGYRWNWLQMLRAAIERLNHGQKRGLISAEEREICSATASQRRICAPRRQLDKASASEFAKMFKLQNRLQCLLFLPSSWPPELGRRNSGSAGRFGPDLNMRGPQRYDAFVARTGWRWIWTILAAGTPVIKVAKWAAEVKRLRWSPFIIRLLFRNGH